MRPMFLSLALACLICLAAAAGQSAINLFTASHFEPDSPASSTALLADGNYYMVSSNGQEIYVVDASGGKEVSDLSQLADILEQDARNRDGYEAKISSAISFPSQVKDAKKISESKCLQYIGDDGDPGCNDRQSCLVSCFSVPQCEIIVQSDGFLEAAMDWDAHRKAYSAVLDSYSAGIDAIRFDPRTIDAKISLLSNLSDIAANMSQNSIFLSKDTAGCSGSNITRRCYEYCPQIDYSPARIPSQVQNLASLKSSIAKIGQQQSRAALILNRSLENDAYLASRGKDYEEFRLSMKSQISHLAVQSAVLAQTVSDPQINVSISQLENISSKAKNYSDTGFYKKALALREGFASLSNNTSQRLDYDTAAYTSYMLGVSGIEEKVKNSAWLIGNASVAQYQKNISALKANYSAPLTLAGIAEAGTVAKRISAVLDAEIASKAVQAGNSSAPPPIPSAPQPSCVVPDFVWIAAIVLAAAIIYSLMLRFARRAPPVAPLPPPPTQ